MTKENTKSEESLETRNINPKPKYRGKKIRPKSSYAILKQKPKLNSKHNYKDIGHKKKISVNSDKEQLKRLSSSVISNEHFLSDVTPSTSPNQMNIYRKNFKNCDLILIPENIVSIDKNINVNFNMSNENLKAMFQQAGKYHSNPI